MAKSSGKATNAGSKRSSAASKKSTLTKPKKTVAKASAKAPQKKNTKTVKLSRSSLMASITTTSTSAMIDVTFTSGIGQLTTSLFRQGMLINLQSISYTGSIHFSDVQSGDTISINGVCTGQAAITISVPTSPSTPGNFPTGNINTGYDIL